MLDPADSSSEEVATSPTLASPAHVQSVNPLTHSVEVARSRNVLSRTLWTRSGLCSVRPIMSCPPDREHALEEPGPASRRRDHRGSRLDKPRHMSVARSAIIESCIPQRRCSERLSKRPSRRARQCSVRMKIEPDLARSTSSDRTADEGLSVSSAAHAGSLRPPRSEPRRPRGWHTRREVHTRGTSLARKPSLSKPSVHLSIQVVARASSRALLIEERGPRPSRQRNHPLEAS